MVATQTVDLDVDGGRMVFVRSPPSTTPGGRRRGQTCPEHGPMDRLNTDEYRFEKDGLDWKVDPEHANADLFVCRGCLRDRFDGHQHEDKALEELVGLAIRKNWRSTDLWGLCRPAAVADMGPLSYCPHCGSEATRSDDTELTCPEHGPLRVEVTR